MLGLKMQMPNTDFVAAARKAGLIVLPRATMWCACLPPLIMTEDEVREGVELMGKAAAALETKAAAQ